MTTCTGAELKRFFDDEKYWRPDDAFGSDITWHDDVIFRVEGEQNENLDLDNLADTAIVSFSDGCVYGPVIGPSEPTFCAYFRRWKKTQAVSVFLVECQKPHLAPIKEAIKAAGGRIL